MAIDNTNPDQDVRKVWISLATKIGVPIRCICFNTNKELARHNDAVRAMSGNAEVCTRQPQDLVVLSLYR